MTAVAATLYPEMGLVVRTLRCPGVRLQAVKDTVANGAILRVFYV